MQIQRKSDPITEITIYQPDTKAVIGKTIKVIPYSIVEDIIVIESTNLYDNLTIKLTLDWLHAIDLKNALGLLIEQQR